jgi:lysophospholipase L1-like esterase
MMWENADTPKSKWAGKVWNVIGDSNTEANDHASRKYHDILWRSMGFAKVNNYGLSGCGWWNSWTHPSTGDFYAAFYKRLNTLDPHADLITVLGGGNDYKGTEKDLVLGQFGDNDPDASFYGAIDHTLSTLIAMYPTKTIAVFTQFRRNLGEITNDKIELMVEAQIKVSQKYGIPCLDLYHNANQYPWLEDYRTEHMPDGIHLRQIGHDKLADKIKPFLESL